MDVRFSPEQVALRDSAARVVDRLGVHAVGELDDTERRAKLDAAVAETGWRELRTTDDGGAPWGSGVEVAIVAEELARGLADAAFIGPTLAVELRRLVGVPEATLRETVAMTTDLFDLAGPGEPAVAVDADAADAALFVDREGVVAAASFTPTIGGLDLTRPTIPLGDVDHQSVGTLTADDRRRWVALALAATTADLVGTMQGAIDLTLDYVKEREQYGTSIGSFQAVQHLLAEAVVHLEGSRTALLHAAWAVDELDPTDAVAAAASAKAYASRAAVEVHETAIQLHGGIGNTWECLAHVYLRRAMWSVDLCGGVGPNLARVLEHAGVGGGR